MNGIHGGPWVSTASTAASPPPSLESIVKAAKKIRKITATDDVFIWRGTILDLAGAMGAPVSRDDTGLPSMIGRGLLECVEVGRWTIVATPQTLRSVLDIDRHSLPAFLDRAHRIIRGGRENGPALYRTKARELEKAVRDWECRLAESAARDAIEFMKKNSIASSA